MKTTLKQKPTVNLKGKLDKDSSIRYLKGVGPAKEVIFNRLGVYGLRDLLFYFPFRYQDRRNFTKIKDLKVGEFSVIKGKVLAVNLKKIPYFVRKRKVKSIFEIILDDSSANLRCVWFNQAYLAESITQGSELILCGKLAHSKRGIQMVAPEYELVEKSDSLNIGKIVGVYRLPAEFNQRFMRKLMLTTIQSYCSGYPDPLPFQIRKQRDIPNIVKAFEEMHFPTSFAEVERARERFIFQELFFSQILVYLRKAKHRLQKGPRFKVRQSLLDKLRKVFSFELTDDQEKVLSEILSDLEKSYPMHRLLQGDVGCGKTIVAAFAMAACVDSGFQAALMVPTEVLAYQHRETLESLFKSLPFNKGKRSGGLTIKVITSSLPKSEIDKIYQDLRKGTIRVIVGTHALIQSELKFKNLGLAVIDEQHRFGVAQRALLPKKGIDLMPHCLVMSATPIPRSLALSLYGDLDSSVISKLPKGRIAPSTLWLKEDKRKEMYDFLEKQLKSGRQAYIIYPLIEESQDEDLQSLETMYDKISRRFKGYSLGMLHGRLKIDQKIKAINDFKNNKTQVLVSTTVVEVGVNVPNATVMVVENPERFGLAQLHQLRGRIQRSKYKPHFIVISKTELSQAAQHRLEVISKEANGFKIAEEDLLLRGPGDFFGNLQHGLPQLKIANPLRDLDILGQARVFAYQVIKSDPSLAKREHHCIKEYLFSRNDLGEKGAKG